MALNEAALNISLNADWGEYLPAVPEGATVIGVVDNGRDKRGALVRFDRSGTYILVRGNSCCTLDQLKVATILAALQSKGSETLCPSPREVA